MIFSGLFFASKKSEPEFITKADKVMFDTKNKSPKYIITLYEEENVKVDDIDYNPSMGWPIDIILPSIKKYEENRKLFSDREWNDSNYFFRCCNCNMDFPLYIDAKKVLLNGKEINLFCPDSSVQNKR